MQNPILAALQQNDPNAMLQQLIQRNPQFARFMKDNAGKTPEQIAQQYGVDMRMVNSILSGTRAPGRNKM